MPSQQSPAQQVIPTLWMSCVVRCLACLFCDVVCCECNCIIFPAPPTEYELDSKQGADDDMTWEYRSFTSEGRNVPYLKLSNAASRKSKKCFIYFHGNAEDIGYVGHFLEPIVAETSTSFYAIEYPSYGRYSSLSAALISDSIKQDALNFYDYLLRMDRAPEDIYVMGRSIGTGGASYLAGQKPVPLLVLMSPFDTIKKVAKGMLGCLAGFFVKQHFNNEEQIAKFTGKLLVIHGENDEVIKVTHGKNLISVYENENQCKISATKVFPRLMTHNNFNIKQDIIGPITKFMRSGLLSS